VLWLKWTVDSNLATLTLDMLVGTVNLGFQMFTLIPEAWQKAYITSLTSRA
jgi:hypothetical protein